MEPVDPRLRGWAERLTKRAGEAVEALAAVPGVTGLVLGGSYGRGEHWPLSDLDFIAVSSGRPVEEVAAEIDRRAYQLSELWGSAGIYTAVDAGKLTLDEDDVRSVTVERLADLRWFHALDKVYGGVAAHDPHGAAQTLLDWSARTRFDPAVVERRIARWLDDADAALVRARSQADDVAGAWNTLRQAATALAEAATERWGERAGSLGRYWTLFEARAQRSGDPVLAGRILAAARADAGCFAEVRVPEWLAERVSLAYEARQLVGEDVTPLQNVRDNVVAYALLYRGRFPRAQQDWMHPGPDADLAASADALGEVADELRQP